MFCARRYRVVVYSSLYFSFGYISFQIELVHFTFILHLGAHGFLNVLKNNYQYKMLKHSLFLMHLVFSV